MKLIFGENSGDASVQLRTALGFIDADFPLEKIAPDLRTATKDMISIIGQATYDDLLLIDAEHQDAPAETTAGDNASMLEMARSVVAINAYRLFAPVNDLQHGTNGRKMLTDDDSKMPFEHMLVKSDDELERRSHRAMDDLITLLDKISASWKASEDYKESFRLFVRTTKEFDRFHVMGSRLLLMKLQPDMEYVETREILPRIGKEVFDSMKDKLNGTDQAAMTEKELVLLPLIREACVNSSLSRGVIRLQGTLFPEGLMRKTRGDRSNIKGRIGFLGNQVDQAKEFFKDTAARVLLDIEAVVTTYEPVVEEVIDEDEQSLYECDKDDKFFS